MIKLTNIIKEIGEATTSTTITGKLDLETLKEDAKTKYADLGYTTEYPDVTVLYFNHHYTVDSRYATVERNETADAALKLLNAELGRHGLRAFFESYGGSCVTSKLVATLAKGTPGV